MTILYHYTRQDCLPKILKSQRLELEGYNIEQFIKSNKYKEMANSEAILRHYLLQKNQYKHTGRYVWFTQEEKEIGCNKVDQQIQLEFDSNELKVYQWQWVYRSKCTSKKNIALMKALNQTAKDNGDDVSKWWVATKPIELNKLKHFKINNGENNE